jgi:hypothetical protein
MSHAVIGDALEGLYRSERRPTVYGGVSVKLYRQRSVGPIRTPPEVGKQQRLVSAGKVRALSRTVSAY